MVNYNKMSKKHAKENNEVVEKIEEIVPEPAVVEEDVVDELVFDPEPIKVEGEVVDCTQMYVRSEPSIDSEPLGIIKCGTKVEIFEVESTLDFYSVCTETGLEGFCMKKFIAVL